MRERANAARVLHTYKLISIYLSLSLSLSFGESLRQRDETPASVTNTQLPGSISPGVLSYHRYSEQHGMVVQGVAAKPLLAWVQQFRFRVSYLQIGCVRHRVLVVALASLNP